MRNGKKQFLVATNIGLGSWAEWKDYIDSVTDDLPEFESMAEAWENMPELSPPLIENVLRQGHKMLIAGPSKAGKSYALIEMSIAIAEGRQWLGWQCAKGVCCMSIWNWTEPAACIGFGMCIRQWNCQRRISRALTSGICVV